MKTRPARWRADWLVALAVFLVASGIAAALVWRIDQQRLHQERLRIASLTSDHARAIQASMERALSASYALAAMVRQARGEIPDFEGVASEMLAQYPGVAVLSLSPQGVITRVVPLAGNEKSIGFNQLADPRQGRDAFIAKQTGKLSLAGPLNLVQGGLGAVGRLPIYFDDAQGTPVFWGFINVVIRFPQALANARLEQLTQLGVAYELWRLNPETGLRQVIAGSATTALPDPVQQSMEMPNGTWALSAAPLAGWSDPRSLAWQTALGLLASALLAYMARLLVQLKVQERGLEAEVAERTAEIAQSQNRLRATLDAIPDPMFELGLDGRILDYHSPRFDKLSQPPTGFVGHNVAELLPGESVAVLMQALREATEQGHSHDTELEWISGAQRHWFQISVARKQDQGSAEPRFILLARDITQRKLAESELRISAAAFDSQEAMGVLDAGRNFLRINPAFTRITGFSPALAVGRSIRMLRSDRHDDDFYAAIWGTVEQAGAWQGEVWGQRIDGKVFPCWMSVTAVKGADGALTHYVGMFSDITARRAAQDEINTLAFYDPLTQLPNRRLLMDRLHQSLASTARAGRHGALQFIDLDNFKTLNDTLGHDLGDQLLRQAAQRLNSNVREGDTVARLGGDEFVVMLDGLSENREDAASQARLTAEKILTELNRPYQLADHDYHSTASIGVALYSGHDESIEELLKQADLAMYQAKAAGRNTLRFFDPEMQAVVSARAALETEIRGALAQSQFVLHYQPQLDREGRIIGAEALLRWPHPQRGMVSPAEFIPLAEDSGLILPLGRWVLETACAELLAWSRLPHMQSLSLSVNVSARQFQQQDFVQEVLGLIEASGARADRLKLELTESLLVQDVEGTIVKMSALQDRGVRFALDDFGTGYSSLAYLKLLPLDQLKIDQSFVRDLLTDPNDAAIAGTVIALGRSLHLSVIAEGVETAEQRDFLAALGCDGYQGYLFGRPMSAQELEQFCNAG